MPIAEQVVHTTGINWASVLTIVLGIVTLLSIIVGFTSRYLGNRITGSIDKFRIEVVSQLDTRLTKVEAQIDAVRNSGSKR
jgi:hypothetical protein